MFYRICHIINIALSFLYLLILLIGSLRSNSVPDGTTLTFFAIMLLIAIIFLVFDFICARIQRSNKELLVLTPKQLTTGKTFYIFNLIAGITVLLILIAAISSLLASDAGNTLRTMPVFYAMLIFFFAAGATSIVNLLFYRSLKKKNKDISTDIINNIGNYR